MDKLDSNMRWTSQRQVISEELKKVKSHPTVNEIYEMVRKKLPRIGLGTVYQNLDILAKLGIISKLEVDGEQKRFDGDMTPHYHIRCIKCKRVDDIFIKMDRELEKSAASCCDNKILDHHVQFSGICSKCLPKA